MIIPTGAIHNGEEAVREYFSRLTQRTLAIFGFDDSGLVYERVYFDLLTILAQLGLVPGGGDVMRTVRPASAA